MIRVLGGDFVMGERKKDYYGLLPLIRFVTGGIIGFVGVALFTTNAYLAVIVAVVCGCVLDRFFANREEKEDE
jgi:hypothetical protein